jgi:hypothetical protein
VEDCFYTSLELRSVDLLPTLFPRLLLEAYQQEYRVTLMQSCVFLPFAGSHPLVVEQSLEQLLGQQSLEQQSLEQLLEQLLEQQ